MTDEPKTRGQGKDVTVAANSRRRPGVRVSDAFDVWLDRELHRMFDRVAQEPVPEELLRLIEQDRDKPVT